MSGDDDRVCLPRSKVEEIRDIVGQTGCPASAAGSDPDSPSDSSHNPPPNDPSPQDPPVAPSSTTDKPPKSSAPKPAPAHTPTGPMDAHHPIQIPGYYAAMGQCIASDSSVTRRAKAVRIGADRRNQTGIDIKAVANMCTKDPKCTGFDVDVRTMSGKKVKKGWIHEMPQMSADGENADSVCYTREYAPKGFMAHHGRCISRNPDDPAMGYIRTSLTLDEASAVCEKDTRCIGFDFNPEDAFDETFFVIEPTDLTVKPSDQPCDADRRCYMRAATKPSTSPHSTTPHTTTPHTATASCASATSQRAASIDAHTNPSTRSTKKMTTPATASKKPLAPVYSSKTHYCGRQNFAPVENPGNEYPADQKKCQNDCIANETCNAWSQSAGTCRIFQDVGKLQPTQHPATGGVCVFTIDDHNLKGFTNVALSNAVWKNTALIGSVGEWAKDERECAETCLNNVDCKSFAFDSTQHPSCPSGQMDTQEKGLCRIFSKTFASESVDLFRYDSPMSPNPMVTADRV